MSVSSNFFFSVGSRSYAMYSYQSINSRMQSVTMVESISALDLLQMGQDRLPWNIHPPSFSNFANLSCCKITVVGSRSSARYSYQS